MAVPFAALFARTLLLGQLSLPAMLRQQIQPAPRPPATQPVHSDRSADKSADKSAYQSDGKSADASRQAADEGKAGEKSSIVETFGHTTLGQLFNGKKQLSPGEALTVNFWLNAVKDLVVAAVGFLPRIFVALLFMVLFWGIYRGIRRLVLGSMAKAHVDSSIRDLLGAVLKWAIMGFGLVIACNQIGIQITALLTGVSIIGLAIGFAAQETLANFIAGIVIFWDKPFRVGNWLDVDGKYGRVLRITFRSTRLLSTDGVVIILPNTSVLAQKVTNHSTNPINRVGVPISIGYKESIDDARAALLATTAGDPRVCRDPEPNVVVTACGDSGVNLSLSFWIKDEALEKKMFHEYLEKAKKALDQANIAIPYPHLQVFVEEGAAARTAGAFANPGPAHLRKAG